ncbi:putative bifunctional diguanylate cyclase/phosphodiesterase [Marinomonas sargassi]|nr:EAL domain-containing protein [Marinomonas sargassi]
MCVIFLLRFMDMLLWKRTQNDKNYDVSYPLYRFLATRYATAIGFSAYFVIFFYTMEIIEFSYTMTIMSAMAGGGASIFSANRGLAYSFAAILLTPASIMGLLAPFGYQNILGMLGILFVIIIFFSARSSYKFTTESILIKNQHADLLSQMALKNQEIVEINSNLEEKVKSRTEEILKLSNIDPLTGLYNRNAFSNHLKELILSCESQNKPLAVLFVDLDGFKAINDTYNHSIGDFVLQETAQRLCSQAKGHSLSRWGGDEFLIALEGTNVDKAYEFGKQLITLLSKPIKLEHNQLSIGATIGIAMYPEHSSDSTQLIALADTAMYVKKQTTKSEVCVFSQHMQENLLRHIELKEGLTKAIERNELHMAFQPVINSSTGNVSFCEALLRWTLNGKSVSPVEFIPAAEQHGMIHPIGSWVLHKACELAANWHFDSSVALSVNVSVAQIMRGELKATVKSALQESGFPAQQLHLEITESIFAEDINFVLEQIQALQSLGVKISVDDFGTGFSSLALLQSLSADIVKIDKSFIQSIEQGGKPIIQAMQYMANELGYHVVAEGVETHEQARVLSEMGISCLQGFYFSKPMKTKELADWHKCFIGEE